MHVSSKKLWKAGVIAFTLAIALFLACSSFLASHSYAASSTRSSPHTAQATSPWTGVTTGWANVRTGPSTGSSLVTTYAPNTQVTVYATVPGQIVWGGIANWYRVSSSGNLYVYGGLVIASSAGPPPPSSGGMVIVISLSQQWMNVYQNGKQVYTSPITSGRPELATPTGTYHIFAKLHPTTFYSPWPPGSPYYYPPSYINYALAWNAGGYFLHDSWWRTVYGPGTNVWHNDPVYGEETGTHGCVTMPLSAASWLYASAPIGTTVQINP